MLKGLFSRGQYKYRKFDYQPMYYDERKEKLKSKIKQSELNEDDRSPEAMNIRKEMLRSEMSAKWDTSKDKKGSFLQSNYRSILFIVMLFIIAYFILFKLDIAGFLERTF